MSISLKHPRGLYVLFFTEMWERFSYYGMRAILVLYMTQYLLNDPEKAASVFGYNGFYDILTYFFGPLNIQQVSSQIYGLYTALVYLTPLFGGMIADRYLGQFRTVYVGAIIMAIGHFLMASEQCFLLALLCLIIGNGAFKPNISSQVGGLYQPGDPRIDSAYSIFYMGINLGASFSPLICGTLGQKVGWHYGFGAAGIGMLLGLVIYHMNRHHIPHDSPAERRQKVKDSEGTKLSKSEWKKIGAICVVSFLASVFWGIYEQQGNTLQLWAEEKTDWNFFGIEFPSSLYAAFNPIMVMLFTVPLITFWSWQRGRKKEPSSTFKMGMGNIICGLGYVFMIIAAKILMDGEKSSLFWLTAATALFTLGELYLSPIGLAFTNKVAPPRVASTMMAVFLGSSFLGNYAAGFFGMFYSVMAKDYFFTLLAGAGIVTGFIFFIIHHPVSKVVGKDV